MVANRRQFITRNAVALMGTASAQSLAAPISSKPAINWIVDEEGVPIGVVAADGVKRYFTISNQRIENGAQVGQMEVISHYKAIRTYTGKAAVLVVSTQGIAGQFLHDADDAVSMDNGGTILVDQLKRRWKRLFSGAINTQWFGAKCDWDGATGTDDTSAIQAAIDYAVYTGHQKVLHPGLSKTTRPIHLGYGYGAFNSIVFEGHGYAYAGQPNMSGSGIIAMHSNAPAIVVQGARGTVVRGLAIIGQNYRWIAGHNLGNPGGLATLDDTDLSNWIDKRLDSRASTRYAPYVGIAIDPYSGKRPAVSYPDVVYPSFLGGQTQYGKNYSSDVLIEDCWIGGFVVGVANQPCDADGNGDFTQLSRCTLQYNAYGVSVGNSQSRNVGLDHCKMFNFHTALTNCVHGRQIGRWGGTIVNLSTAFGIQIFDFTNAGTLGPVVFNNLYCEGMWKLGKYSAGNVQMNFPIQFIGCELALSNQDDRRGIPAYVIDAHALPCPIAFDSCYFYNFPSVVVFNGQISDYRMINCRFQPDSARSNHYEKFAHNFTGGGAMFVPSGSNSRPAEFGITMHTRYGIDSGRTTAENTIGPVQFSQRDLPLCAWPRHVAPVQDRDYVIPAPTLWTIWAKTSLSSLSLIGKTLTGIWLSVYQEWQSAHYGPAPGDVIYDDDSGSVFFVRSIDVSGKRFQAELQNNYKTAGNTFKTLVPFSEKQGNLYIGNSRVYLPRYYLRGDIQTASSTITHCGRDDDYAEWIDTEIQPGDWIFVNEHSDRYLQAPLSKVTARSGAARTITISSKGTRVIAAKPLGFFIRSHR